MRRAGLPADAARCSGTRRPATCDGAVAVAGEAARHRRALRRPRPVRARRAVQGTSCVMEPGRSTRDCALLDEAMIAVTARRAVADRERDRLLRRDPGLPARVRAASRPGVDGGADAMVRAAAGHGRLHRPLHDAPRRAHVAARRVAGGAGRRPGGAGRAVPGERTRTAVEDALRVEGDVRRLRGELGAAEQAYASASRSGREPQPGLALLRLAQGDAGAAAAAIRRVLDETGSALRADRLLPASVEIMLAAGTSRRPRDGVCEAGAHRRGPREAGCWTRWSRWPAARSSWPRAMRRGAAPRFAGRGACGRSSTRRTRSLACGSLIGPRLSRARRP